MVGAKTQLIWGKVRARGMVGARLGLDITISLRSGRAEHHPEHLSAVGIAWASGVLKVGAWLGQGWGMVGAWSR